MSIALTLLGGVTGFGFAIFLAANRFFQLPVLSHLSAAYVDFIRNTPLIVQLFFVAFGLPMLLGYSWPFWAHALLALMLNFSAYFAEIIRAGLASVPSGQSEAAKALGMRSPLTFFQIILPQAIAKMYPSLNSQFIFLFLTTGIIAQIGVTDLTNAGLFIDSRTFRSFEVYITLTAVYLVIALGFKASLNRLFHLSFSWVGKR